jgi:hypothetical protein
LEAWILIVMIIAGVGIASVPLLFMPLPSSPEHKPVIAMGQEQEPEFVPANQPPSPTWCSNMCILNSTGPVPAGVGIASH